MTPLVKNMALAFLAGAVTSLAAFTEKTQEVPTSKAVIISVGLAAVYAGIRGAVGYLKAKYGGGAFAVDTEAPAAE
jgi:coenzyme F420-reducing hydrogenase gamma subunit